MWGTKIGGQGLGDWGLGIRDWKATLTAAAIQNICLAASHCFTEDLSAYNSIFDDYQPTD
jgi:hypothetical protein